MIKLKIKISIVTSIGESKIKEKNIIGELRDIETPPKGLRSPLLAIKNSQKKGNMLLMEPINSPNAKGSLPPPLRPILQILK